ncbi:MAG: ribonuclease P protein component [Candidatus Dasytiphilus stammeri]
MIKYYNFPRQLRLFKSKDFNWVLQQSIKINRSYIMTLHCPNSCKHARIGFIISKNQVQHAYQRNRIKRLIRESFRLNQEKLPSMDFILIIKQELSLMKNKIIIEKLNKLWDHYSI